MASRWDGRPAGRTDEGLRSLHGTDFRPVALPSHYFLSAYLRFVASLATLAVVVAFAAHGVHQAFVEAFLEEIGRYDPPLGWERPADPQAFWLELTSGASPLTPEAPFHERLLEVGVWLVSSRPVVALLVVGFAVAVTLEYCSR